MPLSQARQVASVSRFVTGGHLQGGSLWMGQNALREHFDGSGNLIGAAAEEGSALDKTWRLRGTLGAGGGFTKSGGNLVYPTAAVVTNWGALNDLGLGADGVAARRFLSTSVQWSATPGSDKPIIIGFLLPSGAGATTVTGTEAAVTGAWGWWTVGWTLTLKPITAGTTTIQGSLYKDGVEVATIATAGSAEATQYSDITIIWEGEGTVGSPRRIRVYNGTQNRLDHTDTADSVSRGASVGLGFRYSALDPRTSAPTLGDLHVGRSPQGYINEGTFTGGTDGPAESFRPTTGLAPVDAGASFQVNVRTWAIGTWAATDLPDHLRLKQRRVDGTDVNTPINDIGPFGPVANAVYVNPSDYAARSTGTTGVGVATHGMYEWYLEVQRVATPTGPNMTSIDTRGVQGYYVAKATVNSIATPTTLQAYNDLQSFVLTTATDPIQTGNRLTVEGIQDAAVKVTKTATQSTTTHTATENLNNRYDPELDGVGIKWRSQVVSTFKNEPFMVFKTVPTGWIITGTESSVIESSSGGGVFTEDRYNADPRMTLGTPVITSGTVTDVWNRGQSVSGTITIVNARGEGVSATNRLRVANASNGTSIEAHTMTGPTASGTPPAVVTLSWTVTWSTSVGEATTDGSGKAKYLVWDNTADANTPTSVSTQFGELDSTYTVTKHLQINDKVLAVSKSVLSMLSTDMGYFSMLVRDRRSVAVASVTFTAGVLSLRDDGEQVAAITKTAAKTNALGFIVAADDAAFVWDSSKPGGGWDLWVSTTLVHNGNTVASTAQPAVGTYDFVLQAVDPKIKVLAGAGPSTAAVDGDHWHVGDSLLVGAAVVNTEIAKTVAVDLNGDGSPKATMFIGRFNVTAGRAEYLDSDYIWKPTSDEFGNPVTIYQWPLAASLGDSRVYIKVFTAAQTAAWGDADLHVLPRLVVNGVPYGVGAVREATGRASNHIFDLAAFLGLPL